MKWHLLAPFSACLLATPLVFGQGLQPRELQPKVPVDVRLGKAASVHSQFELVVKFQDALRARCDAAGRMTATNRGHLDGLHELQSRFGIRFRSLFHSGDPILEALELRAAQNSGRAQPDLAGFMAVQFLATQKETTVETMVLVGQALQDLACVEFAEVEARMVAPPSDYAPITPDHQPDQNHRPSNPGMDFAALNAAGALGFGVKFSTCEYGWDELHEDLVDQPLNLEPGQTIHPTVFANGWHDHGTAVIGSSAAPHNGYGIDGAAPLANYYTYPELSVENGARRFTCILNAIAGSNPGDVVLLAMQTIGAGGGNGPAELTLSIWNVIKTGTDAGVVVVAAAGNGSQDLDHALYAPYMARGDSGAILVGAGTSNTNHTRLGFSTYGSRVDVQAWGANVFTTGYGAFAIYGADPMQSYTHQFGGTSSASSLVAGAVTCLQSFALNQGRAPLTPLEMRGLLQSTGIASGSPATPIGPFPDLNAALNELECEFTRNYCEGALNLAGTHGAMGKTGSTSIAADDLILQATDCTPNELGIFLFGPGRNKAATGNGYMCVELPWRAGYTLAESNGSAALPFHYAPLPASPYLIMEGTTWNFQFWYRDGTSYNFTDGLEISFCP